MSDSESIEKMLRSVLQSSKAGVLLSRLQDEYHLLCGERIPLEKLGYSNLEGYVKSIPSVIRLEYHTGEIRCFAAVCKETAHIAELVAKQRSSKKSGCSQVINCSLRFKRSDPYMLNVKPRSSLRQPSAAGASRWIPNRSMSCGNFRGSSAPGDYRQLDKKLSSITPVEHRVPAHRPAAEQRVLPERKGTGFAKSQKPRENPPEQVSRRNGAESGPYNVELVQSRVTLLLEKYCSGLWMSKLSQLYSMEFNQKLHPQALIDLEKWTHICMVEKPSSNLRADRLIYPPLPASSMCNPARGSAVAPQQLPGVNLAVNGGYKVGHTLPSTTLNHKQDDKPLTSVWTCPPTTNAPPLPSSLLKSTVFSSEVASRPPSKLSPVVSADVRQKIKELLSKYRHGLWVCALPKLFMETYKTPFPEHILDNLSLLFDICNVDYVMSRDMKKAILYYTSREDTEATDGQESKQFGLCRLPSGLEVVAPAVPPGLVFPTEQYPSVLISDAKSSNAVTLRYVGENYSNALEAMEDAMLSFYNQSSNLSPLSNPVVGQLVAVRGQGEDELTRAQVMEIMTVGNVKVYYVDHGFSVETSLTDLLELHPDFLSLPFQAINVRLAGLEAFSSHPLLLSSLEKLAVGKILLMETLEAGQQTETPTVVLYDTSQDDDIVINSTCLKALQDKTMNNPLNVNTTYPDVYVTDICADGIICCQLPSRGTARLRKLLEETEAIFTSQMTSESLVSRPFNGKFCLARYKGKWSRVEITKMHGNRVMEVLFIDLGVPGTVEVTDLRETPPLLLKDFTIIPPQATKCRLADLTDSEGDWSPDALRWMKGTVSGSKDCKMKIVKLDQRKELVYVYLFVGTDNQDLDKSVNSWLAQSHLLLNLTIRNTTTTTNNNNNTLTSYYSRVDPGQCALMEKLVPQPIIRASARPLPDLTSTTGMQPLPLPPLLQLPQPGQNMDVFVPSACHPGKFVLQHWQNMHKLVVLMGEMILYYNRTWRANTAPQIQKGEIYAAKIDKNWHRVQVNGILANGLVSVYELDHGKHEMVHNSLFQPLIEEFRHLAFQAVTARLAGVTQHQWSDEASVLFRRHVEGRALVAQVVRVQEASEVKGELWEPKLSVYLVDTTLDDRDLWIHSIMADICI